MAINPPGAPPYAAPGTWLGPRDDAQQLWDWLAPRPIRPIPILTSAASKLLVGPACMIVGLSLRETTGTAAAQVELYSGADANGELVAELTLPAPLPGSVGFGDVDVDNTAAVAASANTATLAGVGGATTFITGFEITGLGATVAAEVTVTIAGILGGSKTYFVNVPLGITVPITALIVPYSRPLPASALNTAITVAATSPGAGNTNFAVTAHGFQRTTGSTSAQTGVSVPQTFPSPGVLCRGGLWMRVISGSVVGSAWVRM